MLCKNVTLFWSCGPDWITQLVKMTDNAVLGVVVEAVSLNPAGVINIFSNYRYSLFIISLHINLLNKSVSVSDPI